MSSITISSGRNRIGILSRPCNLWEGASLPSGQWPVANAVYICNQYDLGEEANQMRRKMERFPLEELGGEIPLFEFVLRFTLSNRAIATAIIGTANPDHMKVNAALSDGHYLPPETLERARREHWRGPVNPLD